VPLLLAVPPHHRLAGRRSVKVEEVTTATPHLRGRDAGAERELGMVWDPQRRETRVVSGFRRFVIRHGRRLAAA
jgi:LysR family transcriptional activator of glutamate synthase operon